MLKPIHGIGKYGGTLRKAFVGGAAGEATAHRFAAGPGSLLYFEYSWSNVARAFEQSADGKTVTMELRRGMKWSSGAPLTADDILFSCEDI